MALEEIQAYPILTVGNVDDDEYVLLADEIRYTMNNLIISTLAEEGYDYAPKDDNDDNFNDEGKNLKTTINLDIFTKQVLKRTSAEEKFGTTDHDVEAIIRFCTKQLSTNPLSSDINVQLSVPKV
jgi:hypothetical protein